MKCEWYGGACTREATHEGVQYEDNGSSHDDGAIVVVPVCPRHAKAWAFHSNGRRPTPIEAEP